jgi:PKD repeat protein
MMMKIAFGALTRRAAIVLVASLWAVGCALDDADVPGLTGPSDFGLSVTSTATPDLLSRDGVSQSVITLTVRDDSGRPVAGQRLTLATTPVEARLSVREVVTDASGQATFTVTAPPVGAISGNTVTIFATPVGTVSGGAVARTIELRLSGAANTTPPTPAFTITPTSPELNIPARFDASTTQDEGTPCLDACSYSWDFGDGSTAGGRVVTHVFTAARTYTVTLNVTDAAGTVASRAQSVTVLDVPAPIVTIAVTPNPPLAGQLATLRAIATPATGHSITRYQWQFGDGTSQTTTVPTVTKTYPTQGVFVVTVTVTDDMGQTGSASLQLTIAGSSVNATIVFSPTTPFTNQRVHFTAVNPTAPNAATIASYEWNFGDSEVPGGGTASGQSVDHAYPIEGNYVVRLTVTDSNGTKGVFTTIVTVAEP